MEKLKGEIEITKWKSFFSKKKNRMHIKFYFGESTVVIKFSGKFLKYWFYKSSCLVKFEVQFENQTENDLFYYNKVHVMTCNDM